MLDIKLVYGLARLMAGPAVMELHKNVHYMDKCCDLLNSEWPRSKAARLRSLQASCDGLPTSLILVIQNKVIGHSKISSIPSLRLACFIESVVIDACQRGKGLGKALMLQSEEYAKRKGFNTMYLSTKDKVAFYSKLGYTVCEPVSIYGCSWAFNNELPTISSTTPKTASANSIQPSENMSLPTVQTSGLMPPPPPPPPMPPSVPSSVLNVNVDTATSNNRVFMKKIL